VEINVTAINIRTLGVEQKRFYGDFMSTAKIKRTWVFM